MPGLGCPPYGVDDPRAPERTVSGGHGGGETPVPIPNTAVKPASADGTWGVAPWESRTPPGFLQTVPPAQRGARSVGPSGADPGAGKAAGTLARWQSAPPLVLRARGAPVLAAGRFPAARAGRVHRRGAREREAARAGTGGVGGPGGVGAAPANGVANGTRAVGRAMLPRRAEAPPGDEVARRPDAVDPAERVHRVVPRAGPRAPPAIGAARTTPASGPGVPAREGPAPEGPGPGGPHEETVMRAPATRTVAIVDPAGQQVPPAAGPAPVGPEPGRTAGPGGPARAVRTPVRRAPARRGPMRLDGGVRRASTGRRATRWSGRVGGAWPVGAPAPSVTGPRVTAPTPRPPRDGAGSDPRRRVRPRAVDTDRSTWTLLETCGEGARRESPSPGPSGRPATGRAAPGHRQRAGLCRRPRLEPLAGADHRADGRRHRRL